MGGRRLDPGILPDRPHQAVGPALQGVAGGGGLLDHGGVTGADATGGASETAT